MKTETLYEVLGVSESASAQEIRDAWLVLVKRWHPDNNVGRESEATAHFLRVQAAYEVLRDPFTRTCYDDERRSPSAAGVSPDETEDSWSWREAYQRGHEEGVKAVNVPIAKYMQSILGGIVAAAAYADARVSYATELSDEAMRQADDMGQVNGGCIFIIAGICIGLVACLVIGEVSSDIPLLMMVAAIVSCFLGVSMRSSAFSRRERIRRALLDQRGIKKPTFSEFLGRK